MVLLLLLLLASEPFSVPSGARASGLTAYVWTKKTGPFTYVRGTVGIYTNQRKVSVAWEGRAGEATVPAIKDASQTVTYLPTAADESWLTEGVIYVAGNSASGPVLERWSLGCPKVRTVTRSRPEADGPVDETVFTVPPITRTAIPIDPAIGTIADIAVNSLMGVSDEEEVWVLEWETSNVYRIDLATGQKTLAIEGNELDGMKSLEIADHTQQGAVCILMHKPWSQKVAPKSSYNRKVYYDHDYDGLFDFHEDIPWSSWLAHALNNTGEFITEDDL